MLINRMTAFQIKPHARQKGVVIVIALIVLVAMTLAGIALVRSVDTTNIIAGNLAFQQSATHAGDLGTEAAIVWLETNSGGTALQADSSAAGYAASRADPAAGQTWDAFWSVTLAGQSVTMPTNATGNTVSYAIQRLCNAPGDPTAPGTGCAVAFASSVSTANSEDAGSVALLYSNQRYYRITSRIVGPRNTVSYVQSVVAL